ncbi:MAG: Mu-like prophage major head subunit gpT family protein [Kiritimatiellales bacterium]
MLINKENIKAFFVNVRTTFHKALKEAKPQWEKIATKVPSKTGIENYAWIKDMWPNLREWIGPKKVKGLEAAKYVIENKPYEATIGVKRDDLEDDQTGKYAAMARAHGEAAAAWPDQLVFGALNEAFEKECFDGQPFIDADHPLEGGKVFSNKGTKKLKCGSFAEAQASYGAARTQMQNLKNDAGRPLELNPNLLVVPPALEDTAKMLLTAEKFADNSTNIYKGTAEVFVCRALTSTTAWFLMDTTQPIKPFIFQERKAPTPVNQETEASDDVFNNGVYKFSIEARGAAGFSLPQLIYGSTGAQN